MTGESAVRGDDRRNLLLHDADAALALLFALGSSWLWSLDKQAVRAVLDGVVACEW
jgi:hypothetical protein